LEKLNILNPCEPKKSLKSIHKWVENMAFFTDIYPESVTEPIYSAIEKGSIRPPKIVFLPEKNIIRTMILTNLKFAPTTPTADKFLALFGLDFNL